MSFPRYPEYKDSGVEWLGEVPGHWQTMQFKRLASIQNGKDYKHIETSGNDGYPVIGSGGEFARATEYLFTGESVLLGRKGTIDKPLYINGSFWVVDTMFYTVVNKKAVPKYLYYCALTIRFDLYSTSTAVPSMTQNDLGSIYFAIPDMSEQQTITAFLDRETAKIDALIAEQQRLIELLKEKRQAVISHTVTKGLNPNAPMKDSGIEWLGEVPEHWEVVALKRVTSIRYGIGEPPQYQTEGTPLIRATNVHNGRITEDGLAFVNPADIPEKRIVWLSAGDIIVVRSGAYTGDSAIISESYTPCIAGFDMVLHCNGVLPHFVQFSLLSKYLKEGQIDLEKTRAAQPHLNAEELGSCVVVFPYTIEEQSDIITFLDRETAKLDTLTNEAKTAIALLQERRTALISAAVTGKIDVRGLVSLA